MVSSPWSSYWSRSRGRSTVLVEVKFRTSKGIAEIKKFEILVENRVFWSKIEFLGENPVLVENRVFGRKSSFLV